MTIDPQIQSEIEKEIAGLAPQDVQRVSMSINQYIEELSTVLGQAIKDQEKLVEAGFDWGLMEKYYGLFENLSTACVDRTTTLLTTPEQEKEFKTEVKQAWEDRYIIKEVAGYIAKRSQSETIKKSYLDSIKGMGVTKLLVGNLELVSIISNNPELASQIRPRGILADSYYQEQVIHRSLDLLRIRGYIILNGRPKNLAVFRQNCFITLCLRAQSVIKEFAHAAFVKDLDYYRSYYCSAIRRKKRLRKKGFSKT